MPGEDERQRKGAFQAFQGASHRRGWCELLVQIVGGEDGHRFGVGLRFELVAERRQFVLQGLEILDDTVVHNRDLGGRDRMRDGFAWPAMGGPARMADPSHTVHRLVREPSGEVIEFTLGAAPLNAAIDDRGDPRGIIPAVFQASQPGH